MDLSQNTLHIAPTNHFTLMMYRFNNLSSWVSMLFNVLDHGHGVPLDVDLEKGKEDDNLTFSAGDLDFLQRIVAQCVVFFLENHWLWFDYLNLCHGA